MAVAFDAVGPAGGGGINSTTSPTTWTHICGGSATAIIIMVMDGSAATILPTAVTYGGQTCTLLGSHAVNSAVSFYGLLNPPTGSNTVSVTWTTAGGQLLLAGSVSFTGAGSFGTIFGADNGGGIGSSQAITVNGTTTGGMIASGVAYGGASGTGGTWTFTPSGTVQWNDYLTNANSGGACAGATVVSTGGGANQTMTWTPSLPGDQFVVLAVEVQPPVAAGVSPAAPGPAWLRQFRSVYRRPAVIPQVNVAAGVTSSGSFSLAPLAFSAQGAQTSPDQPKAQPGPFWFQLFKPFIQKPNVPKPGPNLPAVNAIGSFSLAPVAFSSAGAQTSPDTPQVYPGPFWTRLFKPWVQRPVPPVASRNQVSSSGSLSLAPLAFTAQGAQTSPDIPAVQPGSTWLDLFKPWIQKSRPVPPSVPPQVGITATGSFSLAPLAFAATGAQTSPDIPNVQAGPLWLRLFRPYVPKPLPPLPARDQVSSSGSFSLAPLVFTAAGAQTSPDIPGAQPGPFWQRLFRPYVPKPLPPLPGRDQVSASGSFSLAPLSFSVQGAQTSPDLPLQPGTTWTRLFKPWVSKPRPWIPDPTIPAAGPVATGSFTLAPITFIAQGGATSPDVPQVTPGPLWTRLFKPWINKPLPPVASRDQVSSTGSLSLAPLAFSANAGQTSPDIRQIQPGPMWLRLLRPWIPRPLPPLPARDQVSTSGSFSLAPVAFAGTGAQTSPDIPSLQPGPVWTRLFRPWVNKPVPPLPSVPPQTGIQATGSFALAPLAFTAQGGATSPDVTQVQPGPYWFRIFKPWVQRPVPPVPAVQNVNSAGSFTLAPIAFTAAGAQTSPDQPAIQPGPVWTRLFRPWVRKPLPPLPARDQVSASGNISLAPLAFAASAGQTSPDIPSLQPGSFWLRLFKPWVTRPVPPISAQGPLSATGSLSLAPLAFSGTGAQTSPDIPQIIPGPSWLKLFRPWRKQLPWLQSAPPTSVPCSGGITLAPITFHGSSISPAAVVKYGVPHDRWGNGGPEDQWETGITDSQWATGGKQTQWKTGVISSEWA